jgi:hypothetical protein
MTYLKSTIAGILALFVVAVLVPTILFFTLRVFNGRGPQTIYWNLKSPLVWLLAIIVFSAGFFWEFRRLSK